MSKNQRGFPPPALSQKTREIRPAYPASVDSNLDLAGPRLRTRMVFNVQLARCRVNQGAHTTSFIRTTGLGSRVSNRLQLDLAGRLILGALARVRAFLRELPCLLGPLLCYSPRVSASSPPTFSAPPRHSALVRLTHWITVIAFCALLLTGAEIVISHPRFYWGETGTPAHRPSSLCPSRAHAIRSPPASVT